MLRGMSPVLSPALLRVLWRMGHGDEIVLADAHFPGETLARRQGADYVRADGIEVEVLLGALMPWFVLDQYVDRPVAMMAAEPGDALDPAVEAGYRAAMGPWVEAGVGGADDGPSDGLGVGIERVERFAFYERAARAFAIVMTGETRKYGNVILKKGVVPMRG